MIAKVSYRLAVVLSVLWVGSVVLYALAYPETTIVKVSVGEHLLAFRVPMNQARWAIEQTASEEADRLKINIYTMPERTPGDPLRSLLDVVKLPIRIVEYADLPLLERLSPFIGFYQAMFLFGPPVLLFSLIGAFLWVFAPLKRMGMPGEDD